MKSVWKWIAAAFVALATVVATLMRRDKARSKGIAVSFRREVDTILELESALSDASKKADIEHRARSSNLESINRQHLADAGKISADEAIRRLEDGL